MNFRLTTILYVFALLAAGMAAFGPAWGIAATLVVLTYWAIRPKWSWLITRKEWLTVTIIVLILIGLLMPPVQLNRGTSPYNWCSGNVKQLALALRNYRDAHGNFPPAYTVDANSRRLHSWRVLLLPFIESEALYKQIRLDEPWDSEHNRQFHGAMPECFACPACVDVQAMELRQRASRSGSEDIEWSSFKTTYFMVVDSTSESSFSSPKEKSKSSTQAILVEANDRDVNWMEPVDYTLDDAVALLSDPNAQRHESFREGYFVSWHWCGVGNIAFADGEVEFIHTCTPEYARALLTGENVSNVDDDSGAQSQKHENAIVHWDHIISFSAFCALTVAPGFWRRRERKREAARREFEISGTSRA